MAIFVKDEEYSNNRKKWIEYFENNFKQNKEGSHPSNFRYNAKTIPKSFFDVVDVSFPNGQILGRYLIIVVRNGDSRKQKPEHYRSYLTTDMANLPDPKGVNISKGIAVIFVDEDNHFVDIDIEHDLEISSNT